VANFDFDEDFYEDDEPVEKIREAFDRGEKGLTGPPPSWNRACNAWTWNSLTGHLEPMRSNG
jgi:hypothetical protein